MPVITNENNIRILDDFFAVEAEKPAQVQLFHLIKINIPNDPVTHAPNSPWYIVDNNYDVSFDAQRYNKFPVRFSGCEVSIDGSIGKSSMTIANVSRYAMTLLDLFNGLKGCKVRVTTVYASALDDIYVINSDGTVFPDYDNGESNPNPNRSSVAALDDEFIVDSYSANETAISFSLDPVVDLEVKIPRRRFMVDSCPYTYKDPATCKVPSWGSYAECEKNLFACGQRGNVENFGGFPGINGVRKVYL